LRVKLKTELIVTDFLLSKWTRREALTFALAAGAGTVWAPHAFSADQLPLITKPIPSTGERLPVIGIGTNSFSEAKREELRAVLKRLSELGGSVVDTAASYGESEQVIGELVAELGIRDTVFLATKLVGGADAKASFERSLERLKTQRLDLLQVHNLNGFEELWPQLLEWKKAKRIRYIGATTSFQADHSRMAELMRKYPLDFVQVDYSIANRGAAQTVFPMALERKIAVIVNVPLGGRGGVNLAASSERPLPPFAEKLGVSDWAQLMLKYVVSHPAVTCTIAGSTKVEHLEDNQAAGRGSLPDAALRARIEQYWDSPG
jgi:aryl-alcohol dehydrogenase-like predicted oxidoreductase